ncbi:type II toxin-antitoxin system Phd/YefM family antitoxin [Cystobacter fuscus]|uniref:type II toxin-antitoxin system Phd/YefM family antitoxin n=1 Tax=Cystobacter fuscus TaxID=43 RepID=UPI002B30865D|nr:type II toxin-antitoxin system Phd/YefM family antitoxin [Cystobacter fuscus]
MFLFEMGMSSASTLVGVRKRVYSWTIGMTIQVTMKPLHISEDILPIADFKARASEVVRRLKEHRRPVVITQSGKPAAVLLSPEEFDRLTHRARFLDAVGEGLADAEAGRTVSDEALGKLLDDEFGKLKP